MKKYAIAEYSINEYKELKLIYELTMRLRELEDMEFFYEKCRSAMNIAREWIDTENVLCFAEYSKDDVVILEFDHKTKDDFMQYAQYDGDGIYIEVN